MWPFAQPPQQQAPKACPVPSAIIHKEFLSKTCYAMAQGCQVPSTKTSISGGPRIFQPVIRIHFLRPHQQKWVEGPPPWHGLHPGVSQIQRCRPRFGHSSHWRSSLLFVVQLRGSSSRIAAVIDETSQHLDFFTCINVFLSDCEQSICAHIVLIMVFMEDQANCPEVQVA